MMADSLRDREGDKASYRAPRLAVALQSETLVFNMLVLQSRTNLDLIWYLVMKGSGELG